MNRQKQNLFSDV